MPPERTPGFTDMDRQILTELRVKVSHIEAELTDNATLFVTRAEFAPVKAFVWGLAGLVLLGVGAAVLKLVILQ